jgi:prolipoprotein diacylglyceryl transferase
MIILGIIVAVWLGERRWTASGGTPGTVIDIAVWAVPFGLVGGRLYHVITDPELYFGSGKNPVDALKIWNGGLGIWGAVLLGAAGAYFGCRHRGVNFRSFADAIAPGIAFAQAIGRWGNWFNQELYGRPLHAFWALKIDRDHRPRLPDGSLDPKYLNIATYHPTFLYESIWCVLVGVAVIWAGKRFKLNWGRAFALYVALYTIGRAYFEWLRIDTANHFLGLRLNDYTAIAVFLAAVGYLYAFRDKGDVEEALEPGRQAAPEPEEETGEAAMIGEPESNVRIVGETPEQASADEPAPDEADGTAEDHGTAEAPAETPDDTPKAEAEEPEAEMPEGPEPPETGAKMPKSAESAEHDETVNERQ